MSGAVFLSYASQDADAARRISEALKAAGIEVWLDQSELVGGDAWDQSIRRQIKECALFIPVLSSTTQSRREAYFRLEWKLADERTHLMAKGTPFLLPVTIDATSDQGALVPESFLAVQWTRLPAGETSPAFVERVTRLLGGGSTITTASPSHERGGDVPAKQKPAISTWIWALLAIVLIGGTVATVALRANRSPDRAPAKAMETAAAPTAPKIDAKSVAVLAFADLSEGHDSEYFSDGISEELLNVLAKVPGLKVTARTSSFQFKGKETPMPEIGRLLGVAYVVEGSVRKSGNKVRITAHLSRASSSEEIWSDDFDRDMKDIFAVQDEIAELIAQNLQIKLGAGALAGSGTTNPEALQLYLEGRQALSLRTPAGYDQAEALLNHSIELDPRFARAHVGLADVWFLRDQVLRTSGGRDSMVPEKGKILSRINQALALDPECAEAYASLGAVLGLSWDLEGGVSNLRHAIALNPNYATAHQWLSQNLLEFGYPDEALVEIQRAVDLDPLAPRILDNAAVVLEVTGRYAEAWTMIERARALHPNGTQIACIRVGLLLQQGRKDEALADARRLLTPELGGDDPNFARYKAISVLVACGREQEAEALLPQFPPLGEDRIMALVYLGRMKEAVAQLDSANPAMVMFILYGTNLHEFDSVRDDPQFQAWIKREGLSEIDARVQAWRAAHPPEKSI